jgi:hypothetical protein
MTGEEELIPLSSSARKGTQPDRQIGRGGNSEHIVSARYDGP